MAALVGADSPDTLAAKFGALPSVMDISLSPSGDQIAYLAPYGDMGNALYTATLSNPQPRIAMAANGKPMIIDRCIWVSEQRLLCDISIARKGAADVPFVNATRLVAVNTDTSNVRIVSQRSGANALYFSGNGGDVIDWMPGSPDHVLITHWFVPEAKIGSVIKKDAEGLGVIDVDIATLKRRTMEIARRDGENYLTDSHGTVRILAVRAYDGLGYAKETITHYYRGPDSRDWKPLGTYNSLEEEGFLPMRIDRDKNVVYGLRKLDGRKALYSIALDPSLTETLIYANPSVDVDGIDTLGRVRRVIGVTFADEARKIIYFDKEMDSMASALSRALPGGPGVTLVDTSDDSGKLLVHAGGATDPGTYFVFDKQAKSLNKVLLSRAELAGVALAKQKPITYPAADGARIPAYLTLPPGGVAKNLPAIVMPHGGPWSRDEWGFDWLSQYFALRGYAVIQPNYRGSTGYGDSWQMGNGFKSWRQAIGDVTDAGRWLVSEGIADPRHLAIVGWSYGGYAALQSAVTVPDLFKAVVAIAPVTDFNLLREQYRNTSTFKLAKETIQAESLREASPAQNVEAIRAPVLLFHGDMDQNVFIEESELMASRLGKAGKSVEFVAYPDLSHSLPSTKARTDLLSKTDLFLRAEMGLK
ncbi:alpha/beta hydrolase family protein [Sphingomonas flavalba]|uniref:alpha/beta hydrolase family protein n=1 Tax=Sphingomonas flavalba TaxID=2559804 RepID=UPI001446E72E|nr:S9 family peptidase [Sphingomonas flavalba]